MKKIVLIAAPIGVMRDPFANRKPEFGCPCGFRAPDPAHHCGSPMSPVTTNTGEAR